MVENNDVMQVVQLEIEGIKFFLKLLKAPTQLILKKAFALGKCFVANFKSPGGSVSLKKMQAMSKDLCIVQIDEKDVEKFKTMAKARGLDYTKIIDLNFQNGKTEFMIKKEDLEIFNNIATHLNEEKIKENKEKKEKLEEEINNLEEEINNLEEEIEKVKKEIQPHETKINNIEARIDDIKKGMNSENFDPSQKQEYLDKLNDLSLELNTEKEVVASLKKENNFNELELKYNQMIVKLDNLKKELEFIKSDAAKEISLDAYLESGGDRALNNTDEMIREIEAEVPQVPVYETIKDSKEATLYKELSETEKKRDDFIMSNDNPSKYAVFSQKRNDKNEIVYNIKIFENDKEIETLSNKKEISNKDINNVYEEELSKAGIETNIQVYENKEDVLKKQKLASEPIKKNEIKNESINKIKNAVEQSMPQKTKDLGTLIPKSNIIGRTEARELIIALNSKEFIHLSEQKCIGEAGENIGVNITKEDNFPVLDEKGEQKRVVGGNELIENYNNKGKSSTAESLQKVEVKAKGGK